MLTGWDWEWTANIPHETNTYQTVSNSSGCHSNQALGHQSRQVTSYTQADREDPVINKQNMCSQKLVHSLQIYNSEQLYYFEKWCMLKNFVLTVFYFLATNGLIVLHKTNCWFLSSLFVLIKTNNGALCWL